MADLLHMGWHGMLLAGRLYYCITGIECLITSCKICCMHVSSDVLQPLLDKHVLSHDTGFTAASALLPGLQLCVADMVEKPYIILTNNTDKPVLE